MCKKKPTKEVPYPCYHLSELDMDKQYRCYECEGTGLPYMVKVLGSRFIALCSVMCGVAHYIEDDLSEREYRFRDEAVTFNRTPERTEKKVVSIQEYKRRAMNKERDAYLKGKIAESGIDPAVVAEMDFSTWEGFGWLFKWASSKGWWDEFAVVEYDFGLELGGIPADMVDPDRFADELWKFL